MNDVEIVTVRIDAGSEEAVREAAAEAVRLFRQFLDPNRRRTRDALYFEAQGTEATVGLRFVRTYIGSNDTFTRQHFEDVWNREVRPRVLRMLQQRLKSSIIESLKG